MFDKVICIDDDPIALMLSKLVLAKSSIESEVITALSGKDAFDYLNDTEVINTNKLSKNGLLILLDLNMPVMDGWEFLKQFTHQLMDQYNNTKIILLTSSLDPDDVRRSKDYSLIMDFLPKPLTKEALNAIISKCH
jgi:CheY-like chemotaxis protein